MYPEGFWVAMDDVLLTYSDKRNYYKMQIVNTDVPERPLITAEVNPDAEGPFRADQSYATWDGEKNRLQIIALPKTEDPDGFIVVLVGPTEIKKAPIAGAFGTFPDPSIMERYSNKFSPHSSFL